MDLALKKIIIKWSIDDISSFSSCMIFNARLRIVNTEQLQRFKQFVLIEFLPEETGPTHLSGELSQFYFS